MKNGWLYLIAYLVIIIIVPCSNSLAQNDLESVQVCPLCTSNGKLICPNGFEVFCQNEIPDDTVPNCLFLQNKYTPGCLKYVGKNKLDFGFSKLNLPPTVMINIIGGGETYTLNRETIGCRKL